MKNYLMPMADKLMLRKRFLIETVLDTLKSEMGIEHSRHRSPVNAMVHVLSCLVAYAFRPGKPAISLKGKQIKNCETKRRLRCGWLGSEPALLFMLLALSSVHGPDRKT
jgi:hypothetical protein